MSNYIEISESGDVKRRVVRSSPINRPELTTSDLNHRLHNQNQSSWPIAETTHALAELAASANQVNASAELQHIPVSFHS
ncbi:hypothetical protein FRC03_010998 [Tulasnella sp. 419]|nr:hypothetical protein FRC03_010998 [Tulasnella sp. 419]